MQKSKLVQLLQTFTKAEMRQLCDFAASPYFNKSREVSKLANYLEACAPEFKERDLAKAVVFEHLFPGEPFDAKRLGYLMNYLLNLAEHFLAIQHYQKHTVWKNCSVLNEYVDRKLPKHYNFLRNKTEAMLQEDSVNEPNLFFRYWMADIGTNHFNAQKIRRFDPNLQQASDSLDTFYFFKKLKYSVEMLNRQGIISAQYEYRFAEEVQTYLQEHAQNLEPLVAIYLQIYQSYASESGEQYFKELMRLIRQHADRIDLEPKREVYLYAINFCLRKIRKGQYDYTAVALDLYLEGIESKSLLEGNYLSPWTYTNVVKLALLLERYAWTEEFINRYKDTLAPKFQQDAWHFNLAELFFRKREFGEVLHHLNQVEFSDLNYQLGSRVMLIKTYYELEEIESLLSSLASFRNFLRRNKKISQPLRRPYLNFCNLLHQILRQNHKQPAQIEQSIRESDFLAERAWLLRLFNEQHAASSAKGSP